MQPARGGGVEQHTRNISFCFIAPDKQGRTIFITMCARVSQALHAKAANPCPHDSEKRVFKAVMRFAEGAGTLDFSRV